MEGLEEMYKASDNSDQVAKKLNKTITDRISVEDEKDVEQYKGNTFYFKVQNSEWFINNFNNIYELFEEFQKENITNPEYKNIDFANWLESYGPQLERLYGARDTYQNNIITEELPDSDIFPQVDNSGSEREYSDDGISENDFAESNDSALLKILEQSKREWDQISGVNQVADTDRVMNLSDASKIKSPDKE